MKLRPAFALSLLLTACAASPVHDELSGAAPALDSLSAEGLLKHTKVLASDEFEGRSPGTRGEELSIKYIADQFKAIGLAPGNPDGSYLQNVPLVGMTATRTGALTVNGKKMHFKFPDDFVAETRHVKPVVSVVATDVVFVGYGVVAPEYGWDDYKGVDVRGKTIVMLINDPAIPDPKDPSRLDDSMFRGKAMTYYGRWTYKYEIAAEKGAAAVLIIHETGPAGYPYSVVQDSWGRENFDIASAGGNKDRAPIEAWIAEERARKLFELSGHSFEEMKQAAIRKDFKPVSLNAQASFTIKNKIRKVQSHNVIAKIEGSDPALKDQYLVYSAHWDHFGRDPSLKGDQIFNGALDNASGVAGLLELAQAYKKLPSPPRRSVLFLAVTAEERGLLGSHWYAQHPLYPLARTVANLNMDGIDIFGVTRDVDVVGKGQSTLEDVLAKEVEGQGRVLLGEAQPEKGSYFRSDHFEFAKVGVPALYFHSGEDYVGKPEGWGRAKHDDYTAHHYHTVSDEVTPDWDFSGGVKDLQLMMRVGLHVANDDAVPAWKDGSEFKALRP